MEIRENAASASENKAMQVEMMVLSEGQAKELKELRKVHGIKQQAVADAVGISRATYSRIENGNTRVSRGRYEDIKRFVRGEELSLAKVMASGECDSESPKEVVSMEEVISLVDELNNLDERLGRYRIKVKAIGDEIDELLEERERVKKEFEQYEVTRKNKEESK